MSESSWSGNEKVASRFIRFLAAAYGVVASPAGPTIEQQGEHLATTLDATLPHRIRRFLALLREGGRKHLVGGNNAPLKMGTIDNMASALGHFYAKGTRDFAGQLPHVLGCASRAKAHHLIHTAVRVREVVFAPLHGANLAFFQEHGRPRWVKVSYTRLSTNVAGTAPVPAYYFWSSLASTEEMQASPQFKDSSLCVRCPWLWATMRARAQDCFRVDRQDLMERLDGLVGEFMYWFEDRVIELHEENYGNFFGAGFGVEVAGKVLGKVDVLLRPHGGMLDGEAA
ncbi:hypothetical protein I4F81_001644 [Pyropia yezoensis]|uniref:Uncharacterized protein n=1 Tax=Pyropia yezoensis TaxID=2788 RepID=A0ACC3BMR7_PYRYE|nr:hypothetical protein I4F81_001644 [Neopyropia yezoensis]